MRLRGARRPAETWSYRDRTFSPGANFFRYGSFGTPRLDGLCAARLRDGSRCKCLVPYDISPSACDNHHMALMRGRRSAENWCSYD